jgi:hypothetical protein
VPFKTGANVPLGLELMALEKQDIEDAFLVTVFKVLAENPQMTATQVLEIAQQKGVLLAPTMGRQHSEDLGPLIERELDIASKAGSAADAARNCARSAASTNRVHARRSPGDARAGCARDHAHLRGAARGDRGRQERGLRDRRARSMREVAEINGVPAKLIRDKATVTRSCSRTPRPSRQASMRRRAGDVAGRTERREGRTAPGAA